MKKWNQSLILAWALLIAGPLFASGSKPQAVTAILLQPQQTVMRVAFDLYSQYPVILVSYQEQEASEEPYIHVWDGATWQPLSYAHFQQGDFMLVSPHRVVVAGSKSPLSDKIVTAASSWKTAKAPVFVESRNYDDLINRFGTVFEFKKSDYKWYAERYGLEVKDLAAKRTSWYDGQYVDETKLPKREEGAYKPLVDPPKKSGGPAKSNPLPVKPTQDGGVIQPGKPASGGSFSESAGTE